jgi:hypothetical protein
MANRNTLHGMANVECRLTNCGNASGFASGYDPTGRSVISKLAEYIIDEMVKSRSDDWIPAFAGMTDFISI